MTTYRRLTVGVEEEFIIIDAQSLLPTPRVEALVSRLPEEFHPFHRREFHASQIEMVTDPCHTHSQLYAQLLNNRKAASLAARAEDCEIMAVAVPLFLGKTVVTESIPRYKRLSKHFGALNSGPDTCGQHIHVGSLDKATAVEVCNRLRNYLPIIQALSGNSPYINGEDTGYSSWRHTNMGRFPTVGPFPLCSSEEGYLDLVNNFKKSGIILDVANLLWYSRPSAKYPTVEIRISDIALTAQDSAFIAILLRGLVSKLVNDIENDKPYVNALDAYLREAHWVAAKEGLEGNVVDVEDMTRKPAWTLLDELVAEISPALTELGDMEFIEENLIRYMLEGSGANRQRKIKKDHGLVSLLYYIVTQTTRP